MSKDFIVKVNTNELDSTLARIKREESTPEATAKRAQSNYGNSVTASKVITAPGISNVPNKSRPKLAQSLGGNQTVRIAPQINSPFFEPTNFSLPLDRMTRNAWCRWYFKTDPVVCSALKLHTDYPLTDFVNDCKEPEIKDFFDQMAFEQLNIMGLLHDIGLEYWKIGDVFPMGKFDKNRGVWDHFILLNPDYVDVQRNLLSHDPQIYLIPDEKLKAIVSSGGRGEMSQDFQNLDPEVIESVRNGQNIQLPPSLVSHISHKASHYEIFGTPLLNSCFKTLLYKDKIRTAQQAIVERHITPIQVFKLGESGQEPVTQEEIENFRNLLAQAQLDPNHVIVYHNQIDFFATNNTQTIFQLGQEYEFFRYELAAGLMVNETFITGEGPNFATANVNLEVLEKRYKTYLQMLQNWIEKHVYAPVAAWYDWRDTPIIQTRNKYRIQGQEGALIYPKVVWRGREIVEYKEDAPRIFMDLCDNGVMSRRTLCEKFNLDYDNELARMSEERKDLDRIEKGEDEGDNNDSKSGGFGSDIAPPEDIGGLGAGDFQEEETGENQESTPSPESIGNAPPGGTQ
jgi:hypothetical protein